MRNAVRFYSLFLCVVLILSSVGCSSGTSKPVSTMAPKPSGNTEPNSASPYAQGPQEVIDQYYYYLSTGNARDSLRMLGIAWDDKFEEEEAFISFLGMLYKIKDLCFQYKIKDLHLEKLTGEDYDGTLKNITRYWLNQENVPYEFLYTAFDIQEIGQASFCLQVQMQDGLQDEDNVTYYIVKTSLGWFIAPESWE